jgi:hypothetical protein
VKTEWSEVIEKGAEVDFRPALQLNNDR